MPRIFNSFIDKLMPLLAPNVICIYEFGSRKGEIHPQLSDIDLFIIAKSKSNISNIIRSVRALEMYVNGRNGKNEPQFAIASRYVYSFKASCPIKNRNKTASL